MARCFAICRSCSTSIPISRQAASISCALSASADYLFTMTTNESTRPDSARLDMARLVAAREAARREHSRREKLLGVATCLVALAAGVAGGLMVRAAWSDAAALA